MVVVVVLLGGRALTGLEECVRDEEMGLAY